MPSEILGELGMEGCSEDVAPSNSDDDFDVFRITCIIIISNTQKTMNFLSRAPMRLRCQLRQHLNISSHLIDHEHLEMRR